MRDNIVALPASMASADLSSLATADGRRGQLLYPVVDEARRLVGVITRGSFRKLCSAWPSSQPSLGELARPNPVVAYPDEPLRAVVYRMAETGFTRFPVVERSDDRRLAGMVSLDDLLRARTRTLEEERRRERVLRIRLPFRVRPTA